MNEQEIKLYNEDCQTILTDIIANNKNCIIVTDPPFNIGYHYNTYKDNLEEEEYLEGLCSLLEHTPFVLIHYPEMLYKIAFQVGKFPEKVISWVYNSNTAKQHRDIAFYKVNPDFNKVKQPYKNPEDKRIQERINRGIQGGRLYDWWNINQVKNVSKDKTLHPCQMPIEVMKNIVAMLPKDSTIVDTFMGSGTTAQACIDLGYDFIGCEIDTQYFEIAKKRINA